MVNFRSSRSTAASTTKSTAAISCEIGGGLDPARGWHLARLRSILPFSTLRSRFLAMLATTFFDELLLDIAHQDLQPAGRGDLGDPAAHLAGTDYSEFFDFHDFSLSDLSHYVFKQILSVHHQGHRLTAAETEGDQSSSLLLLLPSGRGGWSAAWRRWRRWDGRGRHCRR